MDAIVCYETIGQYITISQSWLYESCLIHKTVIVNDLSCTLCCFWVGIVVLVWTKCRRTCVTEKKNYKPSAQKSTGKHETYRWRTIKTMNWKFVRWLILRLVCCGFPCLSTAPDFSEVPVITILWFESCPVSPFDYPPNAQN